MGKPPTSHCNAKTVRKADGLVSETKERTTASPIVCITTIVNAIPPKRVPRMRGGEIFKDVRMVLVPRNRHHTSEAYVVPTDNKAPTATPLTIFPASNNPLLLATYCRATPTICDQVSKSLYSKHSRDIQSQPQSKFLCIFSQSSATKDQQLQIQRFGPLLS